MNKRADVCMKASRCLVIAGLSISLSLSAGAAAPPAGRPADAVSPLRLLEVPRDPTAYYEAKIQARSLMEAGKWSDAEPLLERLARDYPRDKENWWLLGQAKRQLKKFAEAAAAYQAAGTYRPWNTPGIEDIITMLAAGNKRAALDALRKNVFERGALYRQSLFQNKNFASLVSDPEFLEIVGRVDATGWTRDYGWRRDIDYVAAEVKRVNPDYRYQPLPAEFVRRQEALKSKVPLLSDEEIFVGMNQMLATLHQGHTMLTGVKDSRISSKLLPLQFWAFPEGVYIVGASPEHQALLGHKLLKIENVAAEDALRQVNSLQSVDGDMEYLLGGPALLRLMAVLKGLGIIPSNDAATLTLQSPAGRVQKVKLASAPTGPGTIKLPAFPGVKAPLFMSNIAEVHWELPLPEHDAMYVQINNILPDKDETLPEFGRRLRIELAQENPKNLIIDLRHNTGGTTQTYPELLRSIVGFSQLPDKKVYVLIGRTTYSAASNFATDLERLAKPVFVGEATSECCNFYGDNSPFTLPYSKIRGAVTAVKWNLSHDVFDTRREISPEVPVQLTAKDYFSGRDPALETVFGLIAKNRNAASTS